MTSRNRSNHILPPIETLSNINFIRLKQYIDQGQLLNGARFVLIRANTAADFVKIILLENWKIPKPKLILSIIGGAEYFTSTDHLESHWINSIIETVSKSDVWLITDGYNIGAVQLVGKMIERFKLKQSGKQITAIAICESKCIKDLENLIQLHTEPIRMKKKQKQKKNKLESSEDNEQKAKEEEEEEEDDGQYDLEMNHSHYIILDDVKDQHYKANDFRTCLCAQLSNLDRQDNFHTSAVTLVIEGDMDTIEHIYRECEAGIPVVLVNGSGGAADLFSRWLSYTEEFKNTFKQPQDRCGLEEYDDVTPVSGKHIATQVRKRTCIHVQLELDSRKKKLSEIFRKYEEQLKQDIRKTFDCENGLDNGNDGYEGRVQVTLEYMMFCLQSAVRSNFTIFSIDSEDEFQETIFGSICLSYNKLMKQKEQELERLSDDQLNNDRNYSLPRNPLLLLSMDWNCIDAAKKFVLKNSLDNIWDEHAAFTEALTKNLPMFIDQFIKLGIDPSEIFFPGDIFFTGCPRYEEFLRILYQPDQIEAAESPLKTFILRNHYLANKQIDTVDGLNIIVRVLVGDYMHKLYFNGYQEESDDRIENGLIKDPQSLKKADDDNDGDWKETKPSDEEQRHTVTDYVMRDLFLWAIMMNYIDMARVLLAHMRYRICPALIASKILKKFHHNTVYGDLKTSCKENAEYFETYAIECLAQCVENDPERACEIILQRNELYGYVTCVEVAADADHKRFIETPCCVAAINNVIHDKLNPNQRRKRDIAALFFGFISLGILAPALVSYRKVKSSSKDDTAQTTFMLEPFGINYSDSYALEHPRYCESMPSVNQYMHRVKKFHQSLLIKFLYHLIFYTFFLLLFSYVLLFHFSPPTNQSPSIHWTEILTMVFVICMSIEEVHYFFRQATLTFSGRVQNYFRDPFKPMTILAIVLFYIGWIVRFTLADSEEEFTTARVIMAFDIELWWLRCLSFLIVIPFFGPQIIAIQKMLKDLLFFLCIILIVMAGYGVASRSLVYYPEVNGFTTATGGLIDTSFDGRSVFRQVIYPVYYLMHNEFRSELTNLNDNPNAGWAIATQVLLAIHVIFVNTLLITLLIAIFSNRFNEVSEETQRIWYFQLYLFAREYYTRTPLLPPLNVFVDIYYLCRMFIFFVRRECFKKSSDGQLPVFKIIAKRKTNLKEEWAAFEGASTYQFAHNEVKKAAKKSASKPFFQREKKDVESDRSRDSAEKTLDRLNELKSNFHNLDRSINEMKQIFDQLKKTNSDS